LKIPVSIEALMSTDGYWSFMRPLLSSSVPWKIILPEWFHCKKVGIWTTLNDW